MEELTIDLHCMTLPKDDSKSNSEESGSRCNENMSREHIVNLRKMKADEARAKKEASLAKKKAVKESAVSSKKAQQKTSQHSIECCQSTCNDHVSTTQKNDLETSAEVIEEVPPCSSAVKEEKDDITHASKMEDIDGTGTKCKYRVNQMFRDLFSRYEAKILIGIDAICVEFIEAFKTFLDELTLESKCIVSYELDQAIRPQLSLLNLNGTKLFLFGLASIIRQLKKEIHALPGSISPFEAKEIIKAWMSKLALQNFDLSLQSISLFFYDKIKESNIKGILTYACCPVVEYVVFDAYKKGLNFKLHIVDSKITRRGLRFVKLLNTMCRHHVYSLLNNLGYMIKQVQLVLLGCVAVFSDGSVMVEQGAAQLAIFAKYFNKPLVVVTQSYKYLDEIKNITSVNKFALTDDLFEKIPAEWITAIITEMRVSAPCGLKFLFKTKQLVVD